MTETKHVYKVAVIDDNTDRYLSVCHMFKESGHDIYKLALEYKIGEITRPQIKNSKIFAYENLDDAKRWSNIQCKDEVSFVILECECDGTESIRDVSYLFKKYAILFWKKKDTKTMTAPTRSIVCNWVRPIKVVVKVVQDT